MNPLLKVIQLYKNETQLIKKAANNHRDAQHMLYQMHAPKMLSVCRYYIKDVYQAEGLNALRKNLLERFETVPHRNMN